VIHVCGGGAEGVTVQGAGGVGEEGEACGGGVAAWKREKVEREGGRGERDEREGGKPGQ